MHGLDVMNYTGSKMQTINYALPYDTAGSLSFRDEPEAFEIY